MSELTLALPPHTSLSPHIELSPVLFTRPDQLPSAAASDLISSLSPGMDADIFCVLSYAMEKLGLEWSPPEEPSRSRVDECFLPGCRQASQQWASPLFPEVYDKIIKS